MLIFSTNLLKALLLTFVVFIVPVVLQVSLDFTTKVYIFNSGSCNILEFIVVL